MLPTASPLAFATAILASATLTHAGCQAHLCTCGVKIKSKMPLVANGFPYDATVYDGHCNKIRYVNMFNGFTASITSRLPWTVEVRLADGAGGYEPLGEVKYSSQTEHLPGNCEKGEESITFQKSCWVYYDDPTC